MSEDLDTFVATDQVERELIWDALASYHHDDPAYAATVQELIKRVSHTFSWVRPSEFDEFPGLADLPAVGSAKYNARDYS